MVQGLFFKRNEENTQTQHCFFATNCSQHMRDIDLITRFLDFFAICKFHKGFGFIPSEVLQQVTCRLLLGLDQQ